MRIPFAAGVMAVGAGVLSVFAAEPPVRCGIEMRNVLLRHFPELEPALQGVANPFAPWAQVGAAHG